MTDTPTQQRSTREWIKHFLIYGLSVVSMNALSFLLIPLYTRRIDPAEYGILELLNRTEGVLGLIVMGGLGLAAMAFYQLEAGNPERREKVFSTAILGIFVNGLILVCAVYPFADQISTVFFRTPAYGWAIRLFAPVIPLEVMVQLGLISLQSRFRSGSYLALSLGRFSLGIAFNLVLVYWLRAGLKGILISTLVHTAVPAILIMLFILHRARWATDFGLWKEMVRYGLPFIPGGIFMFVLSSGDRYVLTIFHGETAVGIYAISYKLGYLVTFLILTPFLKLWGPVMVELALQESGRATIGRIATLLSAAYIYVGLLVSLFSPELVRWVAVPSYYSAAAAVPVVTFAYLFWAISVVGDSVFYATKKTSVKPVILAACCVFCISWYLVLIPKFGGMGAAWATVFSFAFFAILTLRVSQRYLQVPYQYGSLMGLIAYGVGTYLLGRGIAARGFLNDYWVTALAALLFPAVLVKVGFFTSTEVAFMRRPLQKVRQQLSGAAGE
jgi:O-antigen/teichoic acid export membrane protein